jgi:hypothetical protein
MWFIVTNELKDIFLTSLLNTKYLKKKNIFNILNQ